RILKLTLQPLVENAIFHGIGPKKEPGAIHVRARIQGNMLKLYIMDDGVGIEPQRMQDLLKQQDTESKRRAKDNFNSIGILNVHERIKLQFGDPYGLRFNSKLNKGTVVCVEMPVLTDPQ